MGRTVGDCLHSIHADCISSSISKIRSTHNSQKLVGFQTGAPYQGPVHSVPA